MLGKLSSFSIV